jgi:phage virion morphogenesis protein
MPVRLKDKGGLAKLAGWERALAELPKEMRKMPRVMAEEAVELTRQTFEKEADPYGKPWAKLKLRSGRILAKTGGLKGSVHAKATGKRFTIGMGKSYASYHQGGTGLHGPKRQRIKPLRAKALGPINPGGKFFRSVEGSPRRPMIPYKGLPESWAEAFQEIAGEQVIGKLKKSGKRGRTKRIAATGT